MFAYWPISTCGLRIAQVFQLHPTYAKINERFQSLTILLDNCWMNRVPFNMSRTRTKHLFCVFHLFLSCFPHTLFQPKNRKEETIGNFEMQFCKKLFRRLFFRSLTNWFRVVNKFCWLCFFFDSSRSIETNEYLFA